MRIFLWPFQKLKADIPVYRLCGNAIFLPFSHKLYIFKTFFAHFTLQTREQTKKNKQCCHYACSSSSQPSESKFTTSSWSANQLLIDHAHASSLIPLHDITKRSYCIETRTQATYESYHTFDQTMNWNETSKSAWSDKWCCVASLRFLTVKTLRMHTWSWSSFRSTCFCFVDGCGREGIRKRGCHLAKVLRHRRTVGIFI